MITCKYCGAIIEFGYLCKQCEFMEKEAEYLEEESEEEDEDE